jgi:eukaryotic-like serine/threonine-protein kinase
MNKELAANTTLSHYRILSKIGAGGMGEVYLAQDTKLDRKVALKILPADLAANQDRMRRFVQEAKAAAALNHPNIAHIYEIGESDSTNFIAMEFVDGKTLREKIHGEKSELKVFLKHLLQVAEGLAKAHASGIVHRDLKPDNIMITRDGHSKILDFGLAKLLETAGLKPDREGGLGSSEIATAMMPVQHSTPGVVMGTVGYMSPEQAQAKAVDQRSDIFSFGCLLYEVATGRKPFAGDSVIDTLHKIIYEPAPAITDFNPSASPELQRVIRKCLAKEPQKRYQTIRDTANDLEELLEEMKGVSDIERSVAPSTNTSSTIGTDENPKSTFENHKSVAVLPFTNMSADEENEYFCDGLAEELLHALSKIDDLKVAARTSAFSFKGKGANVSEIGEKLGVKNVLEGSVRKSGNRLRISVQLVNVSDGFHLWSERYDREMRDIFNVQDEIALAVVDALKLKLFGNEKAAVLKRYTDNAEVHELFLKGRYYSYKYTAEGWNRAIEFFEKAIEKQPDYAPAYAGMAASRGCLWFFGLLPAEQTIPQSKTAAIRALEIDENLADAHLSLAIITFFYDWEWEKAEQEFKQSIALTPNNAEALSYYALFLGFEERFDEAISLGKRSLEIDPLSPLINMNVGWTYFSAGLLDEALDQAGKMIEIEPNFYGAYWLKGAICLSEGEYEEAVEALIKAVSLGGHQIVLADLGSAYGLAGKKATAEAILGQLLEMRQRAYVPAICIARVYNRIGENEKTIEWLEKAFEERNGEMVFLKGEITGAADGDSLHSLGSDPKLRDLLQKMKLP